MSEDTREQLEKRYAESCRKMEQLMEQLPEMEQKNATWRRLRQLKELFQAEEAYERLAAERVFMEEQEQSYRKAGKPGMSAYIQAQMGYREGPLKEARQQYYKCLKESGFERGEAAREWLESCAANEEQLKQELETFQEEYSRTLAQCQQLDKELYGENE